MKITRRKFIRQGLSGALAVAPLTSMAGCAAPRLDLKEEMARLDQNPDTRALHKSYMEAYDIERSHALSGLQKFGVKSDCCGLGAFRSGLFDVGRFLAGNLVERFSQCRFKRLVVMCGSCQDMFQLALRSITGRRFRLR